MRQVLCNLLSFQVFIFQLKISLNIPQYRWRPGRSPKPPSRSARGFAPRVTDTYKKWEVRPPQKKIKSWIRPCE